MTNFGVPGLFVTPQNYIRYLWSPWTHTFWVWKKPPSYLALPNLCTSQTALRPLLGYDQSRFKMFWYKVAGDLDLFKKCCFWMRLCIRTFYVFIDNFVAICLEVLQQQKNKARQNMYWLMGHHDAWSWTELQGVRLKSSDQMGNHLFPVLWAPGCLQSKPELLTQTLVIIYSW